MNTPLQRDRPTWRKKMVFLTGPRQVGKTTLSRQLIAQQGGQYLNYDVPADRTIILHQRWNPLAPLLVLGEIHKMPDWKAWLKGVVDGKPATQQLLVTGSARMDTFGQSGDPWPGAFLGCGCTLSRCANGANKLALRPMRRSRIC